MATMTMQIPDAAVQRVVDAYCSLGGWTEENGDRVAFAKATLAEQMKQTTLTYEARQAREQALASIPPVTEVAIT